MAVARALLPSGSRPLCVGPALDVWYLGRRVVPSLLPVHLCLAEDATWEQYAVPFLASCVADAPGSRPSTLQLSSFSRVVALGGSAKKALGAVWGSSIL